MHRKHKPRIDRLKALVDLLRSLPSKRFDYEIWVGDDWAGKRDLSCGTTACALGWATTIERQLTLALDEDFGGYVLLRRNGKVFEGTGAAAEYYHIKHGQAETLFVPDMQFDDDWCSESSNPEYYGFRCGFNPIGVSPKCNATPKKVAQHIQKFIRFLEKKS